MSEQVWRHKFVEALWQIIRAKTGLGEHRCYDLAFECVDGWWNNHSSYNTPEIAAEACFKNLCT